LAVRRAIQANDHSWISDGVALRRIIRPEYSLLDTPGLVEALLMNLRDDDVPQNGADAYALLREDLDEVTPILEVIAADDDADAQARRGAERLLAGEYYLLGGW